MRRDLVLVGCVVRVYMCIIVIFGHFVIFDLMIC